MTQKNENVNKKAKYWTFVFYPDSAPKNWRDILAQTGCPCAISPLHDADINADSSQKKAHYHALICFPNTTTYNNVSAISQSVNGTKKVQVVANVKGMYRYLTHQDNAEKAQYDEKDIVFLNGFCPSDYFDLTNSEEDSIYERIEDYILENNITEYYRLISSLKADGFKDLASFARRHTYHFGAYIKSFRHDKIKSELVE